MEAPRESQRLRLATLTRLRTLSITGQTAACVFVAWVLWFPFPVSACFALIALSLALNVWLRLRYRKSHRLSSRAVALVMAFDILQPASLLFLTGGIYNPFAIFLIVPAMIAAATQPPQTVLGLSLLAVASASFLTFFHFPLPSAGELPPALPQAYVGGLWLGIVVTLAFATFYIYRVAAEARALSDALGATELVLQREQHLSALDGLAAACAHELGTPLATIALVAKEMGRATPADAPLREDVDLLITQSERCRDILRRLTSLSAHSEEHMARLPLLSLVEEVSAPHKGFGIAITVEAKGNSGQEPVTRRNAGVLYGLGNIVENAVDFAVAQVTLRVHWDEERVRVLVLDDGPGFSPEVLSRIGDPYMARREGDERETGGGLGLGLFIAKTLLERSGAEIAFRNREAGGASVSISWPRTALLGPALRQEAALH
ncbi:ActS/PrrB/RegB family redox-sensitive histidine kinase [Aureimonas populi]|uniref:histidine kinase n=1 Tax=Aureimonas populi TaxID=1701758 RepID=A0ABW5CPX7_9HYPH|nr:ActS/PrrB/RegB family redox-sensitive histidine kinase [Aureimonas populi]